MNKIKLNPPETAPKDRKFLAFYEIGAVTVSWWRSDQKFIPFVGGDRLSNWPMLGWLEKERFEI